MTDCHWLLSKNLLQAVACVLSSVVPALSGSSEGKDSNGERQHTGLDRAGLYSSLFHGGEGVGDVWLWVFCFCGFVLFFKWGFDISVKLFSANALAAFNEIKHLEVLYWKALHKCQVLLLSCFKLRENYVRQTWHWLVCLQLPEDKWNIYISIFRQSIHLSDYLKVWELASLNKVSPGSWHTVTICYSCFLLAQQCDYVRSLLGRLFS